LKADQFYLGVGEPRWLERSSVPMFVSYTRFERVKRSRPRAIGPWALDSSGFTQLHLHGAWTFTPRDYAVDVEDLCAEVGNLQWAAPMDWMCEASVVAKTGKSVPEHQRLTIENYLELRSLKPDLPFVPVLQGWDLADYLRHVEMYDRAGVDLRRERRVGIGTVCRRQGTKDAEVIIQMLATTGIPLHGFGFKLQGLERVAHYLKSADSMAWSFSARREDGALSGCKHRRCANCLRYALLWREQVLGMLRRTMEVPRQMLLQEIA
jgi:hypothetical protein